MLELPQWNGQQGIGNLNGRTGGQHGVGSLHGTRDFTAIAYVNHRPRSCV